MPDIDISKDLQLQPSDVEAITPKVISKDKKKKSLIETIEIKPLKEYTPEELEYAHAYYQATGVLFSDSCKKHFAIANEMLDRGLIHTYNKACDRVVELIRNYKTYDPSKVSDAVLRDDWRICSAWITTVCKENKRFESPQWKDLSLIEQQREIKNLAAKIRAEMIKRGWHPKELNVEELVWEDTPKQIRHQVHKIPSKEYVCGLKNVGNGISFLVCRLGAAKSKVYSVRFSKEQGWTMEKAKSWVREHKLSWELPEGMTIEDINVSFIVKQDNSTLIKVWKYLVKQADSMDKINEPVMNAAIFVGTEMFKRGLWDTNKGSNKLEKSVEDEVEDYPSPEWVPMSEEAPTGEFITLEKVIKALPSNIVVNGEPYAGYLAGRIVNEGKIPKDKDIDLIFRQHPDPRIILAAKSIQPKWLADKLHVIFAPEGPSLGYSANILRYGFFKLNEDSISKGYGPYRFENLAAKIEPGNPIAGVKPLSGFGKNEFWDIKEMWLKIGKEFINEGEYIQEKIDGRRMQLHADNNKVHIFTEDNQRDRADSFPNIKKEILNKLKCKSCILDGEMTPFITNNKNFKNARDKRNLGELMEREDSASITIGKVSPELEDSIVYVFYDIMYKDGKSLVDLPYEERFKILSETIPKDCKYLDIVKSIKVSSMKEWFIAVNRMRNENGSEGIVGKAAKSFIYPVKKSGENRSPYEFKLKNLKEIDVMVWNRTEKKRTESNEPLGNWMYDCVYLIPENMVNKFQNDNVIEYEGKHYAIIGKSYATNVSCKKGDIVTVMPIRIREYKDKEGKLRWTWMFPYFKEKKEGKNEPDTITTVERIAKLKTKPSHKDMLSMTLEELENSKAEISIKLDKCEYYKDEMCPLKKIFGQTRDELSLDIEQLRFPVSCPIAYIRKCRYLKPYYYSFKRYRIRGYD